MNLENPEWIQPSLTPLVQLKRIRLMTEEVGELICAMDQQNLVEVADALCDLMYVVAGTAVVFGFRQLSVREYTDYENDPRLHPRSDLRPELVVELTQLVTEKLSFVNQSLSRNHGVHEAVMDQLCGFIKVCYEVAYWYKLPLDECFKEVHRSNMSKTPLDEHRKGGKGPGYAPPNLRPIIFQDSGA